MHRYLPLAAALLLSACTATGTRNVERTSTLAVAAAPALTPGTTAAPVAANLTYELRFSPHGGGEAGLVDFIKTAKHTLDLQAYSFTSDPIAEAVQAAKARGVKVRAIFDKGQPNANGGNYKQIAAAGIPCWIDYRVSIAHNKVIIVDGKAVATGSFNFTTDAEAHNAENSLILYDAGLAARYTANFEARLALSRKGP